MAKKFKNKMLNPEQIKSLKEQLLSQIQNLPEDKKAEAIRQIESLSPQALELMLKQQESKEKGVYRLIVEGEIPSTKIGENELAIAVLEINPLSRGHAIIISKKPLKAEEEIPTQIFDFAKTISKKIISKLKASSTKMQTEEKFGEVVIEIIPVYDKPVDQNSKRKRVSKEELEKIASELKVEEKPKIETIKIKKQEQTGQIQKIKRKIP